jgi:outer membrane protein
MKKTLLACLATFAALTFGQAADLKIGTVDLNKIFDAYYKTADAKARIGESENAYKKDRELKLEDYQKLRGEVEKLSQDGQNPALAADVREQKKTQFQQKVQELKNREQEVMAFDQNRRQEIANTMLRMRNALVEEIAVVVKDYAGKNGYTYVFDKTGQSAAQAPMIVYAADNLDFSDEIIKLVNANKPAAGAAKKSADKAPEKAAEKAADKAADAPKTN